MPKMKKKEKLDVKIAESEDEAFWTRLKDAQEMDIKNNKRAIIIGEEMIKICNCKLKELKKDKGKYIG